jgi:predicted dehydrogenase
MNKQTRNVTRRDFVKGSAGVALSLAVTGTSRAFAAGSDTIRVGVIGCGGRGSGAANDCVKSSSGIKIVALADAFSDRLDGLKNKYSVANDHCFTGLNAYKQVLALDDVDMVILATPPGFRPVQFDAAIKAGKHVFMEKPVAVCLAGVNMVIKASELAQQKKLAVVAGTQRRHQLEYVETMKRIHDGAIGDIVSAQCYWNMGELWVGRAKENWAKYASGEWCDVEWQIRNWLFTKWLSGDHICEQHVHNIDVINWASGTLPESVHGMGGRQYRVARQYGNIFDHFGIEFIYPNDVRTISTCRQIAGTRGRVSERVVGTKGVSNCCGTIEGENAWQYDGPRPNPYVQEHADLIAGIRSGKPLNEGKRIAESTLCAIMGRESAYSRMQFKRSYFESRSTLNLIPSDTMKLTDAKPLDPVPIPGQHMLAGWPTKSKRG